MIFISISLLIVTIFCLKCYYSFIYWKKRGVPQGDIFYIVKTNWKLLKGGLSISDIVNEEYKAFPNLRYYGAYQLFSPVLILRSPNVIKDIAVKGFEYFVDHPSFVLHDIDPLWERNLFQLQGNEWRKMRATLTPAFTGSKMKTIFSLVADCAGKLTENFENQSNITTEIEIKDVFTRYTNDVIATTAFGIQCNSFSERNNEFYLMGKKAAKFVWRLGYVKFSILIFIPKLYKLLGMKLYPRSVGRFFMKLIKDTIMFREKENVVRPDMIHLLMEARKDDCYERRSEITDVDITAQALLFFLGGFETVAKTMSFMAYELAVNPKIQQKLYQEITDTLSEPNENLTYEILVKMQYLDMVVSETLRKWPPSLVMTRKCTKPYIIQPAVKEEKPGFIDEGSTIIIPQFGIHRDESFYPKPERFDPERFNDENKKNINPYAYIPFGCGPRNCIGPKFALLEIKAAFVYLLSKFEIVVSSKTVVPIKYITRPFNLNAPEGIWLGLKPRT